MRPLAEAFADAGFSVELPLLPGHGTRLEDLVPTRFEDWLAAAEQAYALLAARSDRMIVAGLSMGGTLCCELAVRHADLAGVVVVNPLVRPPAESFVGMLTTALEQGLELAPGVGSDIKRQGVTELAYDSVPIRAALSLFAACEALAPRLGEIRCPTLLLQSREDHVVPSGSGEALFESAGGPIERVWLEDSYHVATLDNDQAEIEERAVAFALKATAS
jgi:carboxylesterase